MRKQGGLFDSTEEIDDYWNDDSLSNENKAKRMRREATYAIDTSVPLPGFKSTAREADEYIQAEV